MPEITIELLVTRLDSKLTNLKEPRIQLETESVIRFKIIDYNAAAQVQKSLTNRRLVRNEAETWIFLSISLNPSSS